MTITESLHSALAAALQNLEDHSLALAAAKRRVATAQAALAAHLGVRVGRRFEPKDAPGMVCEVVGIMSGYVHFEPVYQDGGRGKCDVAALADFVGCCMGRWLGR